MNKQIIIFLGGVFFGTNCVMAHPTSGDFWHNWDKSISCHSPVKVYTPHSPHDIPLKNGPYRIEGASHSWTNDSCKFKGVILTKNLTNPLKLIKIKDNFIVETGAGILLDDLLLFLEKHKRSLETFPDVPYVTIGGAIATASHGTSFKQGTLSDSVVSVKVVPFFKKIDLGAYAVNVGKLGVITALQLKTIPSEILACRVDTISTSTFLKEWENFQIENKRFQAWYDFTTQTAMTYRYHSPGHSFKKLPPQQPKGYLVKIVRNLQPMKVGSLRTLMMVYQREPRLEAEYIVKRSNALSAILGLEQFLKQNKIKLMRPLFIRFGGIDKLAWLSPANASEPVVFINVDLLHGQEKQMAKIERYLITHFSARFHWGKWHSHNKELMKMAYGDHLERFNRYQSDELKKLYGLL